MSKYSIGELKANVRTHVPDFDMATEIMGYIDNTKSESQELADLKAQNEALMKTITNMGQTTNELIDKCQELEAQNAVLSDLLSDAEPVVYDACLYYSKEGVVSDLDEAFNKYHEPIMKALSTTPSEALEKQRKKDEVFEMLLEACEKTLSENLHLTDGDVCTLFTLREATKKAKRTGR